MEQLTAFIAAAFGGGILVFVQFLITRRDQKHGLIASLIEKVDALNLKVDLHNVENRRRYIFAFSTECRRGIRHTKEEWNQALKDITEYKRYCAQTPQFKNGECDIATASLEEIYKDLLRKNDFAQEGEYEE